MLILDLATHVVRSISHGCPAVAIAVWLGPDHVVCEGDPARVVDLRDGSVRTLGIGARQIWSAHGDKVWLFDNNGTVSELVDPDGAPQSDHDRRHRCRAGRGHSSARSSGATTTWKLWTPTGTLAVPGTFPYSVATLSGDRFALLSSDGLHQFRIVGGAIVLEWSLVQPFLMGAVIAGERTYFADGPRARARRRAARS